MSGWFNFFLFKWHKQHCLYGGFGAGGRERMLKADLNFLLLQMSQEESTRFYDQLNHHIFELVSSSDANERKGGILAIGEWKCIMPLLSFLFMQVYLGTDFQKEWAFILRAWCLTAQYTGCVLVAELWKSVKCQHGSYCEWLQTWYLMGPELFWELSIKCGCWAHENSVLELSWEHFMLPLYMYQGRLTLSTLPSGKIDSCYLNLHSSITAASIPKRGSHSFCCDSDQPLH